VVVTTIVAATAEETTLHPDRQRLIRQAVTLRTILLAFIAFFLLL
jgi:hypothetical protein